MGLASLDGFLSGPWDLPTRKLGPAQPDTPAATGLRMPEALWKAAARLARAHGLSPVAKALGLDYYSLKKRTDTILL